MVSVMFLQVGTTPRTHSRILPSGRGFFATAQEKRLRSALVGSVFEQASIGLSFVFVEAQCNFSNDPARDGGLERTASPPPAACAAITNSVRIRRSSRCGRKHGRNDLDW